MELVYISALIVALSIAVLVIYLIKTLKAAAGTMEKVSTTMERMEKQVEGITNESEQLIQKTNVIADDVQHKTESLNGLFTSLKDVGDSLENVNYSFKDMSDSISRHTRQQSEQVAQAVQWGNAAIDLYAKWQDKKKKKEVNQNDNSYTTGG
ncbi:DUF948 domain-containing protein [Salibacterium sp. K-3]